jgi:PTH1 family peptidyl-tRNA hydrolase
VGGDDGLLLVAPQTYMNRSGFALRCLAERQEIDLGRMLVVYDEVRLPLGRLRARRSGSPGGHRGLESILENVGTDEVQRLRLGVGPIAGEVQGEALVDFVLDPFVATELEPLQGMIQRAADACELWASRGIDAAMQEFNG